MTCGEAPADVAALDVTSVQVEPLSVPRPTPTGVEDARVVNVTLAVPDCVVVNVNMLVPPTVSDPVNELEVDPLGLVEDENRFLMVSHPAEQRAKTTRTSP